MKLTEEEGYEWGLIRGVWASSAIQLRRCKTFLCLGDEARMNYPSKLGWWTWRLNKEDLTRGLSKNILELNKIYMRYESEKMKGSPREGYKDS